MGSPEHIVRMDVNTFLDEATRIVDGASKEGIVLRLLGAVSIYVHSRHDASAQEVMKGLGRLGGDYLFSDLDFVAYGKQRGKVAQFLEKTLRFEPDRMVNAFNSQRRLIYYNRPRGYNVDIFFDKLEFSHTVQFGSGPGNGRLELDTYTLSLSDIALTKLQINKINLKDLMDLNILFLFHEVVREYSNRETVDAGYIASVLSDDWGFWYDATANLGRATEVTSKLLSEGKISEEASKTILNRIQNLRSIIDAHPKSKNWEKRAKTGTSKPWYQEFDEVS